jgi:hypothetical protein
MKSFYKPNLLELLNLARNQGASVRPVMGSGQTGASGVQILQKSYLPHPDSDLDVPHMNLDLLDETYSMVKSKLYFVDIDHTGLTGGTHRSDRANQTCQFWMPTPSNRSLGLIVRTYRHLLERTLVLKTSFRGSCDKILHSMSCIHKISRLDS